MTFLSVAIRPLPHLARLTSSQNLEDWQLVRPVELPAVVVNHPPEVAFHQLRYFSLGIERGRDAPEHDFRNVTIGEESVAPYGRLDVEQFGAAALPTFAMAVAGAAEFAFVRSASS